MPLTDPAARNAKPKDKPYRLADEKGMYLEIHPSGGKYWRLKYRFGGKEKRLALGVYPDTALAEARRRRDYARELVAAGADPGEAKKAAKVAQAAAADNNFEAVARAWHARGGNGQGRWVPLYAGKVLRSLEVDVFPAIGKRPVAEIRPPEVLAMLRKIEARGTLETLKRIRQRVRDIFTYAIAQGLRENENPVGGLEKAVKPPQEKHYPSLHVRELPELFIRLDAARLSLPVKHAVRLTTLLFLRSAELRGARWEEIDLKAGTWTIPGERDRARGLLGMKMKRRHVVPLPRQAVAIFRELQAYSGSGELVFPNRNDPSRPISDGTINSALRAMGYAAGQVTGHGFRATAASALAEMGYRREVIDTQLSHLEKNQVLGAYVHQAEYLKERRAMLQQWADYLDNLEPGKVLPMKRKARA